MSSSSTKALTIYPILLQPHKILSAVAEPAPGADAKTLAILENMLHTLYRADGVGLAAPQVGVSQRLVVADIGMPREDGKRDYSVKKPVFYINPEIVWSSEETSSRQEGCLSLPNVWGDVIRPTNVRVKYMTRDGEAVEEEFGGLASVVIQHEIDHLNGVLFTQRMSKVRRDIAMGKWAKIRKGIIAEGADFDVLAAEVGVIKAQEK
jgi:peptide deformylase